MATLVGGVITSHIPAIGNAITHKQQDDPYWKPLFNGYARAREWMEKVQPDIAVVIYNDHGLNFFLDKMPTFAMGAASEYHNADEGWGLATLHSFEGDVEFSWHLIEHLIPAGVDLTICQEMLIDHGFIVPMSVMWSHLPKWPVKAVPFAVNTVLMPVPTAQRCYDVGLELGKAIRSYPEDKKVVVFGTGGMSHQLSGERAGYINKEFDRTYMDKIIDRPEELCQLTHTQLIQEAGAEGIELIMWLVMRAALGESVNVIHQNYELPISNTGSGIMVMEPA